MDRHISQKCLPMNLRISFNPLARRQGESMTYTPLGGLFFVLILGSPSRPNGLPSGSSRESWIHGSSILKTSHFVWSAGLPGLTKSRWNNKRSSFPPKAMRECVPLLGWSWAGLENASRANFFRDKDSQDSCTCSTIHEDPFHLYFLISDNFESSDTFDTFWHMWCQPLGIYSTLGYWNKNACMFVDCVLIAGSFY